MAEEVIMPKFGMSMEEGTISEWLKKENESVEKGEPLVTISSEKITNELEAPTSGVILKITADVDDTLKVGNTLAFIGEEGETINQPSNESKEDPPSEQESAPVNQESITPTQTKSTSTSASNTKRVKISPAARKLAKAHNVPIIELTGTGPQGRITKRDVQSYINHQTSSKETDTESKTPSSRVPQEDSSHTVPVKGIRKVIAERMHRSLQESAQLTLMRKADITELLSIQKKAKQDLKEIDPNISLTATAFIARATVKALTQHQRINSTYVDGEIHLYDHVDLGMATSLNDGLVVPVISRAERQTVVELARNIQLLSQKARDAEINGEDLKGSTFTITNLGSTGTEYFTPILNPPETGILGVGAFQEQVVLRDDKVEAHQYLPLSLTFDHRALDGDPASKFLSDVIYYLEHPYQMLL